VSYLEDAVEKLYAVVGAVSMVLLPVAFVISLCYDLGHPERWSDWQHDPRIYGTAAILVLPPLLWLWARAHRKQQRMERRSGRLISIANVVEKLFNSGRSEEAQEAYRLYQRVRAAKNEAEEGKLANQFWQTFSL
jgi:hypothetical protein